MRIRELLERNKENNKIAIKMGEKAISYKDLHMEVLRISNFLSSVINDKAQCVSVFLPNSIEYVKAYFAIQYIECIIVPLDISLKTNEIISAIHYCGSDLIITDTNRMSFIMNSVSNYSNKVTVVNIETMELYVNNNHSTSKKSPSLSLDGSDNDVAVMLHTSGTTSNPKRVMLTHSNIINNVESNIESLQLSANDCTLIALPMYFGYCHTAQFLTHIYLGAKIIILDSLFLPKPFFHKVETESITNFTGVPTMLLSLLDYRFSNKYDYSSLRFICFGGGKMPIEKLKKLIEAFPSIGFVQTYGQTECSPRVTALLPEYSLSKIGSVGKPIPNVEVRIIDENDQEINNGEIGEITVRGKNVMKGYYKHDELTNFTIRDGWLHTGDIGYFDDDGFLFLKGRIKNIIISGGINIYPEEIEETILTHPDIEDAYVYGEEHERLGEVPIARIVSKVPISDQEILSYCSERLAAYKVPARIERVSCLPKTFTGKIKRKN